MREEKEEKLDLEPEIEKCKKEQEKEKSGVGEKNYTLFCCFLNKAVCLRENV